MEPARATSEPDRPASLVRARRLELFTIGWNVVEGVVAITAAVLAGSVALLGFGIDSFVESASAGVLLWRITAERRATDPCQVEALERRALRLVGLSFFALAAWVAFDSTVALASAERPAASPLGIGLLVVSIAIMWWLAGAKRSAARALGSAALAADAAQTRACWHLSAVALTGLALNAALGWWWADPAAALGIALLLLREGREAWNGDTCCG